MKRIKTLATLVSIINVFGVFFQAFQPERMAMFQPAKDETTQNDDHTHQRSMPVAILQISDREFQKKQILQYATIKAYANMHGYGYHLLDPEYDAPECHKKYASFFFQKPCTVAHFLEKKPDGFTVVVLDGDVVAGSPNVSLQYWLVEGRETPYRLETRDLKVGQSDLLFYLRSWTFEIAAGNYIARRSPFTLRFLRQWADYQFHQPKGFSSADNGALHLVFLQALGISSPRCVKQYRSLEAAVDDLKPYYGFVACTRRATGPIARTWMSNSNGSIWGFDETEGWGDSSIGGSIKMTNLTDDGSSRGQISIYNRYHGFAVDWYEQDYRPGGNIPLHHGVKKMEEAIDKYGFNFRLSEKNGLRENANESTWEECLYDDACTVSLSREICLSREEQASFHREFENYYLGLGRSPADEPMFVVPRFDLRNCLATNETQASCYQLTYGANETPLTFENFSHVGGNIYVYPLQQAPAQSTA